MLTELEKQRLKTSLVAAQAMIDDLKRLEKHHASEVSDLANNACLHLRIVKNDLQKLIDLARPVSQPGNEAEQLWVKTYQYEAEIVCVDFFDREVIDVDTWMAYIKQVEKEKESSKAN